MNKILMVVAAAVMLAGCASYTVPGGPAPLNALGVKEEDRKAMLGPGTSGQIRDALAKRPLVTFPANIAVVRVQASDYGNYGNPGHAGGGGAYSVVTVRDVETEEDFAQIAKLPQIAGVAGMKRILLNQTLNSDEDLREAAAKLHANLLLYYTFDTQFRTETHGRELGVITLGLFPDKNAKATCTASAVLMDVNNGYIYSVIEVTSKDEQLANAWSSGDAMDDVRKRVEKDAFGKLVAEFKNEWVNVVAEYVRRN